MTQYEYHINQAQKHEAAGNLVRAEWHLDEAEKVKR